MLLAGASLAWCERSQTDERWAAWFQTKPWTLLNNNKHILHAKKKVALTEYSITQVIFLKMPFILQYIAGTLHACFYFITQTILKGTLQAWINSFLSTTSLWIFLSETSTLFFTENVRWRRLQWLLAQSGARRWFGEPAALAAVPVRHQHCAPSMRQCSRKATGVLVVAF